MPALFTQDHVLLGLSAAAPAEVIASLVEVLALPAPLHPSLVLAAAMAREADGSTAVGDGFACPHARVEGLDESRLAFAVLREPVLWGGAEVRWAALVVAPAEHPAVALKLLGQLARVALSPELSARLLGASDPVAAYRWLKGRVRRDDTPLTAEDIMRPSYGQLGPDTPITEITRGMAHHNLDCAGITDADRRIVGQITADNLFTHGMPDFFRQLESVGFIAEFDPFERYFSQESKLLARDVMTPDFATCPPTATILEVVHLLSVKGHPKVFVVDEERRLLGVIDRIRVVHRLLDL
jgi:PTS system nitrogen regulatory IIA component